ncbi:MAG: ROK family protein [Candidatus Nanohaloarchaea archaeon]|nr:ROK family protein [Candidatus Nanohaloarchaea archaeon]
MAFLCLDIGGTNTLIGVGNDEFDVVEKRKSRGFVEDLEASVEQVLEGGGHSLKEIDSISVAAAGPIDRQENVFYPPNIDGGEVSLEPLTSLANEFRVVNDCNAAVLGEYRYGDYPTENLLYLTLSSGIGAGVVMDGELVEGADGNFGEVGHMQLVENGMECGCGGEGHWEAYCSGESIPRLVERITGESFQDARSVFESYRAGNTALEPAIERIRELNVRGVANLASLYNPEVIAVGGGVGLNHMDLVLGDVQEEAEERSVNGSPRIRKAQLGEESIIQGLRAISNGEV